MKELRISTRLPEEHMSDMTLSQALEAEHHEIDGGIETYTSALAAGVNDPAPLVTAMAALRRHIYLEEEFLFPPLRSALTMPILVMLKEHGQIWGEMDALDALLEAPDTAPQLLAQGCQTLLEQLERHNEKEEPIIYAHAASALGVEETAQLQGYIATGSMPAGRRCERAA